MKQIRYIEHRGVFHPVNLLTYVDKYAESTVNVETQFLIKTLPLSKVPTNQICKCCDKNKLKSYE